MAESERKIKVFGLPNDGIGYGGGRVHRLVCDGEKHFDIVIGWRRGLIEKVFECDGGKCSEEKNPRRSKND